MGKKLLLTFGFSIMMFGGFLLANPNHAAAATWCGVMANPVSPGGDTTNGRCIAFGQNYTALYGLGDVVAPYTTPSATLKTNFINYINAKSASPYYYQRAGAAFIKNGLDGGTGTWASRITNGPGVTFAMETFNSCGRTWPNTAWDTVRLQVVSDPVCKIATPALVIRVNGVIYYAIKADCGNPMGDLTALPSPSWALTSSTTLTPANGFPGASATFTHKIVKSGAGAASYVYQICGAYSAAPVTSPAGCSANSAAQSGSITKTFVRGPFPVAQQGRYYCERIWYTPKGSVGGSGTSSGKCFYIKPIVLTCGSMSVTPPGLDPFMPFSVTVSATNSTGIPLASDSITLSITGPRNYGPLTQTNLSYSGATASATFGPLPPTGLNGRYTVSWTFTSAAGTKTCNNPADVFEVTSRPYLAIYGGDAVIGDSPTAAKSCYTDVDGGAYGWNSYTTTFKGAGAQYAVMALGTIQEFASNLGALAPAPDKLAFANVDYGPAAPVHNVATGLFGGMFGATNTPCDFVSDLTVPQQDGPSMLLPSAIPSGDTVKYAKGNVYISNNIIYNGSGAAWASLSAIPSFKLVVEGDIYIASSVTQLDGLYVALIDGSGNGGNIYTCATSIGNDVKPGIPGFYDTCKTKLTINGAFIAKQVHFLRTIGSLGQATTDNPVTGASNAAEVFNYGPEMWLPRNTSVPSSGRYNSITGLPPVL